VKRYDAVVVGSGPNGLGAAVTIARAGRSVLVLEGGESIGGGMRSAELTLPGFVHDVCSAVHPLGASSPLFRRLPLAEHGLEWIQPTLPLAHPFDDGSAIALYRSIEATVAQFPEDAAAYRRLFGPLATHWDTLMCEILQPVVHIPRHPLLLTRFGVPSLRSASGLATSRFKDRRLQALFTGSAGHAILPLDKWLTASFGLVLNGAAHGAGWPVVRGGSQRLADALASYLRSLGGEIETHRTVRSLDELPPCRAVLFDIAPERLLEIAGHRIAGRYRKQIMGYRQGEAVFKVDYALSEPIPWTAPECHEAGTVHLGGHVDEMVASEDSVAHGQAADAPLVLVGQQSLFDSSRAPEGQHTLWAYCHVPRGSSVDMSEAIERQIERFAPGFRDTILARSSMDPAQAERHNPNLVGGDITGGSNGGLQLFFRPGFSLHPYNTPAEGVYLCSASTPPAGGVHGMCGYWAARAALKRELR
jgi:phytoene dehydrogenase-like protein